MKTPRFDKRGFTLIELVIVVLVMGLLLAVTLPAGTRFLRSSRVTGAANTLMADIQNARSLASMKRRTHRILFTSSGYTIFQVSPADTIRRRVWPTGVGATATDTATFFAWGLTDPVSITITGANSSKIVQVFANGSVTHN
jgi:prepilin-type N-terminal cleavage/methylation domain-containing protein